MLHRSFSAHDPFWSPLSSSHGSPKRHESVNIDGSAADPQRWIAPDRPYPSRMNRNGRWAELDKANPPAIAPSTPGSATPECTDGARGPTGQAGGEIRGCGASRGQPSRVAFRRTAPGRCRCPQLLERNPAQRLRQHGHHRIPNRMVSVAPASGLPSGAELRDRERLARKGSSGIGPTDLEGCWLLDQVWPKRGERPAPFSNAMLRGLGARLEIRPSDQPEELELSNAVRIGALELRFHGRGRLVGSRPLLQFQFDALVLSLADRPLLRRSLPPPKPQRLPFFALIARGPEGWLAARGRGGGLALWRLASMPDRLASGGASTHAAAGDG